MTDTVLESKTAITEDLTTQGDLQDVLLRTLAAASEPVSAAAIAQQLPRPYRVDLDQLTDLLNSLVDGGQLHRHSPYRVKADRFWDRSPIEYAEHLLTTQTHGRFSTRSELTAQFKARCRDVSKRNFDTLIKELSKSGKLHSGKFLGSRAVRYSADPIDAAAVADNALDQIAKRFSLSSNQLQQLISNRLIDQDQSSGSHQVASSSAIDEEKIQRSEAATGETDIIWDAIAEICPEGGGSIVPIAQLRRLLAFKVDRETLDDSLRLLERDGRIDFTVHPDPSSLTVEQRSEQLTDRVGKVFDMLIVRR